MPKGPIKSLNRSFSIKTMDSETDLSLDDIRYILLNIIKYLKPSVCKTIYIQYIFL